MGQNDFRLTPEDIKAIRQGTSFVVRLSPGEDRGTATLTVIKELRHDHESVFAPNDPYERREVRREIACYAESRSTEACFGRVYPDGAWEALRLIVRAGDVLRFSARENSNGYLRAAMIPRGSSIDSADYHHPEYHGLYADELIVSIVRAVDTDKPKTIVHELVLDRSTCPHNTGRPIKNARPRDYSLA